MRYDNFIESARGSYAYDPKQIFTKEWAIARELFEKNYLLNTDYETKIPKKIHQIWLGSEMPSVYRKLAKSWSEFNPDYEYKLWTDKDVKNLYIGAIKTYKNATNPGMKSDILRYEILRQFGGIYVDTDFECLRSFEDFETLDFYTGIGYDEKFQLYIGLIASVPFHPILNSACHINGDYAGHRGSQIMEVTGANHFTRAFFKNVNENTKGVVCFPTDFFYPWPNNLRDEKSNPYQYLKESSYAIHHWAISWTVKK